MSTNTTSTNDTIPTVIQEEEKYKTAVQEQIDKEDELADKIQNMINAMRKNNLEITLKTKKYVNASKTKT